MSASSRGVDPKAQCQNLLMRFRVIELKELLRSIGQSTKGRKPELMQRSTDLLRHGSPKIQVKIQEIWERSHASKKPDNYYKMAERYTPVKTAGQVPSHHHKYGHHQNPYPFKTHRGQYVIHPDVKFKENPFFIKFDTIIRPTALVSTNITAMGGYSMKLEFHLTPLQVQKVYSSRTSQGEYNTQVVMRFCRYEISCEQEDFLPKGCVVRINGQFLQMPSHAHNRPEHQRRCNPLDITHYIKTTPTHTNEVTIIWHSDVLTPQGFVTTIELAENLSSSDLLTKLKAKGIRSADYTRALVKEKLSVDKDSEISATSLKVSLICPLGKLRITNPCRAMGCQHLQCFDASIYLQMNERKARWVCPVCDKPAPFDELAIDGLFKEICEQSPHNDIEFSADGSWHPFSNKPGSSHYLSSPEKKAACYSPVMIRDTPDDDEVERDGVSGASGRGKGAVSKGAESGPIVIDLTLSSSDEEEMSEDERSVLPGNRRIRRQSSSSSTTSASSGEERDDAVTTINTTSGCVSPRLSTCPPPTAVGRGSSNNGGAGAAAAAAISTCVVSGSDNVNHIPSSGDETSNLINKDWLPILNSALNTFPLLFPPNFTSPAAPVRLDADSANPALQLLTAPQSSGSVTSLQTAVSKPPLSSSLSGQPVSVITSRGALPIPPYQQFQPSSELNSDPFLPPLPISISVDDTLLQQLGQLDSSTFRKL